MPRACREPPRSGAESRRARTALRASGQCWRRGCSQWLRRGIGSRDGWRSSPAPAAGSGPPPRGDRGGRRARRPGRPRRRGARTAVARRIRDAGGEATPVPTDVSSVERRRAPVCRGRGSGPARGSRLRGRRADAGAVDGDDPGDLGGDAGGQPDRLVPLLSRRIHRDAGRRRRTDRQHRVAVRRLRHREVPWTDRLQRLQVRGHRSDGGDRGRGQGARDQRDLRQSRRGRHPDAASRPIPTFVPA